MRAHPKLLLFFLLPWMACGQTVQPEAPAQVIQKAPVAPEDRCVVEGTVLNSRTGEPVRKASVTLFATDNLAGGNSYGAFTDAAGKFRVIDVNPGRYRILIMRGGYVRMGMGARVRDQGPAVITLSAKQVLRDLSFKLQPGAVVSGRIVDEAGDPITGARVMVMRPVYDNGRRRLAPVMGGSPMNTSDDQGQYRYHSLPPGRYYIVVQYLDPRMSFGAFDPAGGSGTQQEEAYAPVYYPGVLDPSQTAPIQLKEGDERRGLDIRMAPVRTVRVRGRIVNPPAGRGNYGVSVELVSRSGEFVNHRGGGMLPDGTFEIRGATPGSYYILATYERDGSPGLSARRALEVGQNTVEGVELTLQPGFDVKGRVVLEREDTNVKLAELQVYLHDLDPGARSGFYAEMDANGAFTFKNVAEGELRPQINGVPPGYYVKSVRLGDVDGLEKGLNLTAASAAGELLFVLSPNAAKVEGMASMEAGKPAVGATIVLVPEARDRTDLYKIAAPDQSGRFVIPGVAPGYYKLFGWDSLEPGAYQDPAFLKPFDDKGKTVTVAEREQKTIDLTVIKTEADSK